MDQRVSDPKIEVIGELNIKKICEVLSLILNCTVVAKKKEGVEHETEN